MLDFKGFKDLYEHKKTVEVSNTVSENPCVSICVQTYNHEKYINQCLESLLGQKTSFSFEILLGEDNSSDGTREICKDFAKKYPDRIRLFLHNRENNISINNYPTGRFNFLYNFFSAKGKYIAFCEGDDYWTDPLKLEKQFRCLEDNRDYSLCFHNAYFLDNRKGLNERKVMLTGFQKKIYSTEDLLDQWFIPSCSIFFRNVSFQIPEWLINSASGDIALLLYLSLHGRLKFIDGIMGVYRKHDEGLSITHHGYNKVFSMIYLYQSFDIFTSYKFHSEVQEAIKKEIRLHLPEFHELRRLRRNKKVSFIEMSRKILRKLKSV